MCMRGSRKTRAGRPPALRCLFSLFCMPYSFWNGSPCQFLFIAFSYKLFSKNLISNLKQHIHLLKYIFLEKNNSLAVQLEKNNYNLLHLISPVPKYILMSKHQLLFHLDSKKNSFILARCLIFVVKLFIITEHAQVRLWWGLVIQLVYQGLISLRYWIILKLQTPKPLSLMV